LTNNLSNLESELKKQKTINYLIGEIIKYATNLEPLDDSMEKMADMLTGILGLSTITIKFNDSVNDKAYCRSIENGGITSVCSCGDEKNDLASMRVHVSENDSTIMVPLIDHKNNSNIGYVFARSNNSEFFDSSILSFFEILAIQIPIIVSNALLFEKMKYASIKDILTNSFNRKHLNRTLFKIAKENLPTSLAFFDLDNFKFVNDTFGHSFGDRILLDVSEIALSYCAKNNGELFRYGGDEFIMLFYECPLEKAKEILEELRTDVMIHLSSNLELDIKQTISIGLSNYPETVDDPEDLLDAADSALIRGKLKQKNKLYIGYEKSTGSQN
jgi:diguanylate cyclase (GGDEF)-like protein